VPRWLLGRKLEAIFKKWDPIYLSIYIYSIPVIEKLEQSWNPGNLRWHTELGIFLRLPDVTTKLLPNKQGLNSKKWG
jgi:hypothetical protein